MTDYSIYHAMYINGGMVAQAISKPLDDLQQECTYNINNFYFADDTKFTVVHNFRNFRSEPLWKKGDNVEVVFQNIYFKLNIDGVDHSHELDTVSFVIYYENGNVEYHGAEYETRTDGNYKTYDVKLGFTPTDNVETMALYMEGEFMILDAPKYVPLIFEVGEPNIEYKWNYMEVDITTKSEGLLGGILGKLQEVKDNITNVVKTITELPQKIWQFIENGLKSLFVPDEEYIVEYKDKWDTLLENKLGAVYEVANVTFESWDRVKASDEQNTIQMPEVTIPLPDNNEFTFGGYDVKIVPDGFGFLATSVKLITAVVCTIAFVNGLRKRYDEVMGVEQ